MPSHPVEFPSSAPDDVMSRIRADYVRLHASPRWISVDAADQATHVWANKVVDPTIRLLWTPMVLDRLKSKANRSSEAAARWEETDVWVRVWWHPRVFDEVIAGLRREAQSALCMDEPLSASDRWTILNQA